MLIPVNDCQCNVRMCTNDSRCGTWPSVPPKPRPDGVFDVVAMIDVLHHIRPSGAPTLHAAAKCVPGTAGSQGHGTTNRIGRPWRIGCTIWSLPENGFITVRSRPSKNGLAIADSISRCATIVICSGIAMSCVYSGTEMGPSFRRWRLEKTLSPPHPRRRASPGANRCDNRRGNSPGRLRSFFRCRRCSCCRCLTTNFIFAMPPGWFSKESGRLQTSCTTTQRRSFICCACTGCGTRISAQRSWCLDALVRNIAPRDGWHACSIQAQVVPLANQHAGCRLGVSFDGHPLQRRNIRKQHWSIRPEIIAMPLAFVALYLTMRVTSASQLRRPFLSGFLAAACTPSSSSSLHDFRFCASGSHSWCL